jgi:hypothetical protein
MSRIVLSLAVGLSAPAMGHRAERAAADDKCTAKCDEEADKCSQKAGKDAGKQRDCDSGYDACLRQCN